MRNYIGEEGVLKSEAAALVLVFEQVSLCKKRGSEPRFGADGDTSSMSEIVILKAPHETLWKSANST